MPRKTQFRDRRALHRHTGFNEAAARCRGKPPEQPPLEIGLDVASMRPRPDAAENGQTMRQSRVARDRLQ